MNPVLQRLAVTRAAALLGVLALHGAVIYGLWNLRVIPRPDDATPIFVTFIDPPPAPQPRSEARPPPKPPALPKQPKPARPAKQAAPRPVAPPQSRLAAEAPVVSPAEATEPLPPPEPVEGARLPEPSDALPPASPIPPAGPVSLASELALVCPDRTPPPYPPLSRRLGETGKVVLRVELDETGRVSTAQVITSSGFERLDAAALAAVRTWRCRPAQRDGQPVRALATQPFDFTLEGP